MNWLKSFWEKLNAPPPTAAPKIYTSSTGAKPPASTPPNPLTTAKKTWHLKSPAPQAADSIYDFTPRAQQTLALARKEAERLSHNFVGTEHLLLGLMALGQGVAVNVLRNLGLDIELIRAEVEKQIGPGPDQKMIGNIPYTPRVKKVLALAVKEAKALHHTYIGTEHILLGLLREGDGVAARVLKNLDVDVEKTRQKILSELDPNSPSAESAAFPGSADSAPEEPPPDRSNLARDLFTPRVRRAFTLAREEAEQRNQPFIETEHILLGLIRMGQGVAASVLIKIGVNADTVGARIENEPEA
jgi:ATP-dependent Clp protease ATP-binding subunit ClpA